MKTIKRVLFAGLLLMLMTAGFAGAEENKLYEKGIGIAAQVKEMSENDAYLQAISGSERLLKHLESVKGVDPEHPAAVYQIRFEGDGYLPMLGLKESDIVSQTLRDDLRARSHTALIQQVNAMGGAELIAASSICTSSTNFIDEAFEGDVIYLYVYENAVPVMVAFSSGAEQIVRATGSPILCDMFTAGSQEEIQNFFEGMPIVVEAVSP